jgi:hypothetical protein
MKRSLFLIMVCAVVFGGLALTALAAERAHTVFAEGGFPTG